MKQNNKGVDFLVRYWGTKSANLLWNMLADKRTIATRQKQGIVREGDWVVRAVNGVIRAVDNAQLSRNSLDRDSFVCKR